VARVYKFIDLSGCEIHTIEDPDDRLPIPENKQVVSSYLRRHRSLCHVLCAGSNHRWNELANLYRVIVRSRGGLLDMQENTQRVDRFIEAFEKLYGRKPKLEDAEGNFKIRVALDMQISVGGARYYLRLATEREDKSRGLKTAI